MNGPLSIDWIRRYQYVNAPSPAPEGFEPMMVLKPCEGDLLHVWFCESCRVNLANVGQLEMHFEKGGAHRIAVWCGRRGVYEEAVRPESLSLQVSL